MADCINEMAEFVRDIAETQCSDQPTLVPVQALPLRFTHHTINSEFAFGENHDNRQGYIFKLFLNCFWGRLEPEQMEERLHVFKHIGVTSHLVTVEKSGQHDKIEAGSIPAVIAAWWRCECCTEALKLDPGSSPPGDGSAHWGADP